MPDPHAEPEFPKWIGDSLWISPNECALNVYATGTCGRAGDDYYSCSTFRSSAVLRCSRETREFLIHAFRNRDRITAALEDPANAR